MRSSIHSFIHVHFIFVLFCVSYVTVVEFCPLIAHQAMNTSLWMRKDKKHKFILLTHMKH